MRLKSLTPNLMVEDVNQTISYYTDKLGFTLLMTVPETGNFDWAMMKRHEVVIMFQSKKSLSGELPQFKTRNPGGGMTMYIKLSGIQELYEDLQEKAEIISDLENTFYGATEFSIMDINGYILTFSEDKG